MGAEEITFEDLLESEPAFAEAPGSLRQLLVDGFPPHGGLEALTAIEKISDSDPQLASVQRGYLQLLEMQKRGAKAQA